MIAIREMDDSMDNRMIERDKKSLQRNGWMVVMMSRDFHFWTRILGVFANHGQEEVKKLTIERYHQAVDEELANHEDSSDLSPPNTHPIHRSSSSR